MNVPGSSVSSGRSSVSPEALEDGLEGSDDLVPCDIALSKLQGEGELLPAGLELEHVVLGATATALGLRLCELAGIRPCGSLLLEPFQQSHHFLGVTLSNYL